MGESAAAIFAKIAIEKGLLDDKKLEQARTLQRLARKDGKVVTIDKACVELDLLTQAQVKGLERGLKYYIVRKADKIYGKLAVQKKFVEKDVVENCLDKQKAEFAKKRLVRVSKLLMDLDAIDASQDGELREAVTKRLSAEESHHEANAVSEEEAKSKTKKGPAAKGRPAATAKSGKAAKAASASASASESADSSDETREKGASSGSRKAFISGPKKSGERKGASSESGRAAATSGRKNIDVGKKGSASGRAWAAEAKKDEKPIPPRPVRPSKERKAATISSEDDLEAAPVLDILAPDAKETKSPKASPSSAVSDDTEKLPAAKAAESGEMSPPDASDERPAIPAPAPISASETTEAPEAQAKPPAPPRDGEALAIDSKDEEFLLDDDVEVPAKPAEAPKAAAESVDWALPGKIEATAKDAKAAPDEIGEEAFGVRIGDAVPANGTNGANGTHAEETLAAAKGDALKFSSQDET